MAQTLSQEEIDALLSSVSDAEGDGGDNTKIVMVEWHDARFYPGTYTKEECKEHNMCLFESLGYILSKDKITLRIAAERNDEGEYRDITLIPAGSVISIKELRIQGGNNGARQKT